jgi:phage baseplate assembly protein W
MAYQEYQVFGRPSSIDFGARGVDEVLQNVRTYLCTPRFSVVLDRAMGIDASLVDRPINKAQAILSSDIFMNLSRHEPRAKVLSIDFSGDGLDGTLVPVVKVRVNLSGFE